jgi:hypothetical protein
MVLKLKVVMNVDEGVCWDIKIEGAILCAPIFKSILSLFSIQFVLVSYLNEITHI